MRYLVILAVLSLFSCSKETDCTLPDNFLENMYRIENTDTTVFFSNSAVLYAIFGERELNETPEEVWIKIGYNFNLYRRVLRVSDREYSICRIGDDSYLVDVDNSVQIWTDVGRNTQIKRKETPK